MVMFWPIQQELDCISDSGDVLGRIKFDGSKNEYTFSPVDESIALSGEQHAKIVERLAGLASGKFSIPMQDDDWHKYLLGNNRADILSNSLNRKEANIGL